MGVYGKLPATETCASHAHVHREVTRYGDVRFTCARALGGYPLRRCALHMRTSIGSLQADTHRRCQNSMVAGQAIEPGNSHRKHSKLFFCRVGQGAPTLGTLTALGAGVLQTANTERRMLRPL